MRTAATSIIDSVRETIVSIDGATLHFDPCIEQSTDGIFEPIDGMGLCGDVQSFVRERFPYGLFRHQHAAVEHVLAGRHTVTSTRTSSGKSLIYSLPALNALCVNELATALFLYPQKALANDQLIKL